MSFGEDGPSLVGNGSIWEGLEVLEQALFEPNPLGKERASDQTPKVYNKCMNKDYMMGALYCLCIHPIAIHHNPLRPNSSSTLFRGFPIQKH
jgi:hypothetical protein